MACRANIGDKKNKNKLDGLFCIFNMDEKNRKSFARKIGVDYNDLIVFSRLFIMLTSTQLTVRV